MSPNNMITYTDHYMYMHIYINISTGQVSLHTYIYMYAYPLHMCPPTELNAPFIPYFAYFPFLSNTGHSQCTVNNGVDFPANQIRPWGRDLLVYSSMWCRASVRSRRPGDEDGAHQGIVSVKSFLKNVL